MHIECELFPKSGVQKTFGMVYYLIKLLKSAVSPCDYFGVGTFYCQEYMRLRSEQGGTHEARAFSFIVSSFFDGLIYIIYYIL